MVEHLKVLNSRALPSFYLLGGPSQISNQRATQVPLLFNLLIGWGGLWSSPLKGDGGLISRACLRILISRAPLPVLGTFTSALETDFNSAFILLIGWAPLK